jgi:hypothetical protein
MNAAAGRIDSYFSLPTDLAAIMRDWPEFTRGEGYLVDLEGHSERVSVRLVPASDDDCQHVVVQGDPEGRLFHAVLGRVAYALAANSDNVTVCRWSAHEVQPITPADGFAAR